MTLYEKLQADVKQAMLARDEVSRDTLRMLVAAVKKQELEQGKEITEELVMTILQVAAKTRAESIAQFTSAGRNDLVAKEQAELAVVRRYLPQQLDEAQTKAAIQALIGELGITSKKDLGTLMKAAMAKHKGVIDGKLVQKLAGELLA
ncbi:MAG: GatB/YqeY domain-containing protein [Planctomycetota bacterium]|nr:GatB/YqeY domain-containing protein [Planctomycetota bacterium]